MKKILMVCTIGLEKNGITTCILNYSSVLINKNMSIAIVAINRVSDEIKIFLKKRSIQLYELPMRNTNTIKYLGKLEKIIKSGGYDVVHVHGNSCTMAVDLLAAQIAGCKVRIAHSHNTTCEHVLIHKILRPLFEFCCTEYFACGQDAGKWLFGKRKFIIIKNGIDLLQYMPEKEKREQMRNYLKIAEDTMLIGHVGFFNNQKNHDFLIELFAKLLKESKKKYKLLLIGDGELRSQIESKAEKIGIQKYVIFTGNVNDVSDYLQAMDIFLLPSKYEGLPYVLIEAQAAGLKCLVSNKVSKEANITNSFDFLKITDVMEWVDALKLFDNKDIFKEKEKNIKEWKQNIMDAGYDIRQNAENLKKIYRDLLEKRKKKNRIF